MIASGTPAWGRRLSLPTLNSMLATATVPDVVSCRAPCLLSYIRLGSANGGAHKSDDPASSLGSPFFSFPAFRSFISRSLTSSPFNLYHVPKVIRSDPRCRLDCVASRGAVRGHPSLYGTLREFTPPVWPFYTNHKYILVRRSDFGLCRRLRREQQGRRPCRRNRRLVRHDRRLAHRSKGPQPCCLEYVPPSFSHS